MPRAKLGEGEYYHIFNRGVDKRHIFSNDADRWRFLTLLCVLQGEDSFPQIGRIVPFVKSSSFDNDIFNGVIKTKYVDLISFCLMPNHFHLKMRELKESGVSKFMQRLLGAYTKYFNIRYGRTGHLFGSRFRAVHIDSNEYLNYLSAYIHLNPRELKEWSGKEIKYPWSSFQDFAFKNRWGAFLNTPIILDQFATGAEYKKFVEDTPIKELRENLPAECQKFEF
ncbi:hypothetical protein A3B19_00335 [Candidatus Giovannonibacteria bacterium RIFCSPLOWO2_01_FULL_46_32]|uniref:Transposase IS200-like domain-containing protein n=1 Tax=Candidatus Giovannonibacteria bacterium RIFCSPLOWO2_01_FULL_46_32 TaxID=1798353 RepID=A0A1F5XFP1_9BACT|nr:MAG: hypothetical protein A3B19_00335 [Candidatus Giovannonibacteria bacterium RIFCSPLOWO2_01_FULL_46_32]